MDSSKTLGEMLVGIREIPVQIMKLSTNTQSVMMKALWNDSMVLGEYMS